MILTKLANSVGLQQICLTLIITFPKGVNNVNKNDLIAQVAQKTNFSKADAARALDAVLDSVKSALAKGKEVRLVNFGTFLVVKRKATEGRNPRTGSPIKIPASKQPKFRAGKALKEACN